MKSPSHGKIPRRGEIWWIRLDPTIGSEMSKTRPGVVVSANPLNERRRTVVVVPLSSSSRSVPPLTVRVKCAGRQAVAIVDQVRAVAKERLTRRIEEISIEQLEAIEDALRQILELD